MAAASTEWGRSVNVATVRSRLAAVGTFDALLLASGVWFLGKFTRYAFPPLFETFQTTYGVSNGMLGVMFTGLMIAYAGMQFPSGALADRFGGARVVAGGAAVLAAAALLLSGIQAFPVLVVGMIVVGIGTGVHKTVAINLLATVYPARRGRALGVMDTAGELAGVAAPAAVVLALATVGWPSIFLVVGIVGAALAGVFYVRMSHRPSLARTDSSGSVDPGRYVAILRRPRFATFVVVVVTFSFAWTGLTAFLPLYLTAAKDFTAARAGLVYGGIFAVSVVQPLTGALSDRIGRFPLLVSTLGLAAGCLGLLTVSTNPIGIAALVLLVGVGSHGFRPVRDSYLTDVLPSTAAGGTLGVIRTVMMGAAAAAPAVVGYGTESVGWEVTFGALAVVYGMGVGTVSVLALLD